jgi:alpha-mannosidase
VTEIDWHDRRTFLRAEFDLAVLADAAQFDQAIGVIARPTHTNTSWQKAQLEACGHRFVSLSETGRGAALLSSDKYGFSAKGSRLGISLVRGPMFPDMLADEGRHQFTYSLLAHDGRWWSNEVQAEADLVLDPPRFVPANVGDTPTVRPLAWSGQPLRVHALKPAEDGEGYVLRVSERSGSRGAVNVTGGTGMTRVNGLEEPLADTELAEARAFELISLRVHP